MIMMWWLGLACVAPEQPEPLWPPPGEAIDVLILGTPQYPYAEPAFSNVFRGLLTHVPFQGSAKLVDSFDDDPRERHILGYWPGIRPSDQSDSLRWEVPVNTAVVAPLDGMVVEAETGSACVRLRGTKHLVIESRVEGIRVHLAGLVPTVRAGDPVSAGTVIGKVSQGPCGSNLWMGIHLVGRLQDPLEGGPWSSFFRLREAEWARLIAPHPYVPLDR